MDRTESRPAHPPGPASDDAAPPSNPPPGAAPRSGLPAADGADLLDFEPVPLRCRTGGLTPDRQRAYVEALADCGLVREAAARAGISEQSVNRARRRADGRDFDRACEAAHLFGARRLRSIAFERAVEGTLKGHYYHGERVGEERVFDNRLLIYLLGKTAHLLEPGPDARAVCADWDAHMDALGRGAEPPALSVREAPAGPAAAPEEEQEGSGGAQVWLEDGIWWTFFPPPEGFDGVEEGALGDEDYQRTLSEDEERVIRAREAGEDAALLARCCAVRDRFFGLPPRGTPGFSFPREAETSETCETSGPEAPDEGPIEYKSLEPPAFLRKPEPPDIAAGKAGGQVPVSVPCPRSPSNPRPSGGRRDRLPPGRRRPGGTGFPGECRLSHIQTGLLRHPCG